METLFAKQDRLLSLTLIGIIKILMYKINWGSWEVLYCTLDSVKNGGAFLLGRGFRFLILAALPDSYYYS